MSRSRRYPSDLSEEEWALVAPLPPKDGRPATPARRDVWTPSLTAPLTAGVASLAGRCPAVADGLRRLPPVGGERHDRPTARCVAGQAARAARPAPTAASGGLPVGPGCPAGRVRLPRL